jgi:molecular chaperone DnaJ
LIREGNDLIYNLFVSIPDAILGTHVEIPTVDNNVKIKIEPGTQPGKILRLRGKGLPEVNGYGRGDLLVNVNVWIPKNLTREEMKLIEKFRDTDTFTPKPDKDDKGFFERMRGYFHKIFPCLLYNSVSVELFVIIMRDRRFTEFLYIYTF